MQSQLAWTFKAIAAVLLPFADATIGGWVVPVTVPDCSASSCCIAGDSITSIEWKFTLGTALSADGDTITITAKQGLFNANVFAGTSADLTAVVQTLTDSVAPVTHAASVTRHAVVSSTPNVLTITIANGGDIQAGLVTIKLGAGAFSALTTGGSAITFDIAATGNTALTGQTGYTPSSSCPVAGYITPVTVPDCSTCCVAGDSFTSIEWKFTLSAALVANADTITITAKSGGSVANIFQASADLTAAVGTLSDSAGPVTHTGGSKDVVVSSTTSVLTLTLQSTRDIAKGLVTIKMGSAALASLTAAGTQIDFDIAATGNTALTGQSGYTPAASCPLSAYVTPVTVPDCGTCCAAGALFTSLEWKFTLAGALTANSNTIVITAKDGGSTANVFAVSTDLTASVLTLTDSGGTVSHASGGHVLITSIATALTLTVQNNGDIAAGQVTIKMGSGAFAAITAAGTAITFDIAATGNTALTAQTGYTPVSTCPIGGYVTPVTVPDCSSCCIAGDTFTSIKWQFEIQRGLTANGDAITITAKGPSNLAASIFAPSADHTAAVDTLTDSNGPVTHSGGDVVVSSTASVLTITVQTGGDVASGLVTIQLGTAAFAAITTGGSAITFDITATGNTAITGNTGYTPSTSCPIGGYVTPVTIPDCASCCTDGASMTSMKWQFTLPTSLSAAGNTITVTAKNGAFGANIFSGTNADLTGSVLTLTDSAGAITHTGGGKDVVVSSSSDTLTLTVQTGGDIATGLITIELGTAAFAGITAAGTAITFDIAATGITGITAQSGYTPQASCAMSGWVTPTTVPVCSVCCAAGSSFTSIEWRFTLATALTSDGNTITITAKNGVSAANIFAGTSVDLSTAVNTLLDSNGAVTFSGGSRHAVVSSTASVLTITVANGGDIAAGQVTIKLGSTAFAAITAASTAISFDVAATHNTGLTAQGGYTPQATCAGTVLGDPIAEYGHMKTEFVIPQGTFSPLLQSPDIHVSAKPHPGEKSQEQWLSEVRVTSRSGLELLEVRIRNDLAIFNRSRVPRNAFESLEIRLGPAKEPVLLVPPPDEHLTALRGKVVFLFGQQRSLFDGDGPRREVVMIVTAAMKMVIVSSSAQEFYTDPGLALKHAHLDLMFPEINQPDRLSGLLPELWGLQPLSNTSASTIKHVIGEAYDTNVSSEQEFATKSPLLKDACDEKANPSFSSADGSCNSPLANKLSL